MTSEQIVKEGKVVYKNITTFLEIAILCPNCGRVMLLQSGKNCIYICECGAEFIKPHRPKHSSEE